MKEVVQKRTHTAKHFDLSDGQLLGEFHIGHIHFRDGALKDGGFRDIDTTLQLDSTTGKYRMTSASYECEIEPSGAVTFYNVDHFLRISPPNTFGVQPKVYSGSAFGQLGKALIWENFLQQGGHMIVEARNNALARIFRFERKPVVNRIPLGVMMSDRVKFIVDGQEKSGLWSLKGKMAMLTKGERVSYLRLPRAWNHRGERVDVEIHFSVDAQGRVLAEKVISQEFIERTFNEAGAWLETDDTSTFFSGAGDGTIYAIDEVYPPSAATSADTTPTQDSLSSNPSVGGYYLTRTFFPVDTSSLPDAATIAGATFSLFGAGAIANEDGETAILVQTSQASTSSLTPDDWTAVGSTEGSRITFASWSGSAYNVLTLNATGREWISKTGFTKLGLRALRDILANPPTGANYIEMYFSETTGTSQDPKLEVVYTVPTNVAWWPGIIQPRIVTPKIMGY